MHFDNQIQNSRPYLTPVQFWIWSVELTLPFYPALILRTLEQLSWEYWTDTIVGQTARQMLIFLDSKSLEYLYNFINIFYYPLSLVDTDLQSNILYRDKIINMYRSFTLYSKIDNNLSLVSKYGRRFIIECIRNIALER